MLKTRHHGITLIELLLTLTLVALLSTIAVPSFSASLSKVRTKSDVHRMTELLRFARLTAIAESDTVLVCASASGTMCEHTLIWSGQIIVVLDHNHNHEVDSNDTIIRIACINHGIFRSGKYQLQFNAIGGGDMNSWTYFPAMNGGDVATDRIVVNLGGRIRWLRLIS